MLYSLYYPDSSQLPHTILDVAGPCNVTGVCQPCPSRVLLRFPLNGRLCYNREAVKNTRKQESAPADVRSEAVAASAVSNADAASASGRSWEDASRFCPICSQRLESRRCKLVCNVCGYYMSCADYY
jgi:NADH pyrophosphatase NudC (nudix superfamily)